MRTRGLRVGAPLLVGLLSILQSGCKKRAAVPTPPKLPPLPARLQAEAKNQPATPPEAWPIPFADTPLEGRLAGLAFAEPQEHGRLAVYPVVAEGDTDTRSFLTMEKAHKQGAIRVRSYGPIELVSVNKRTDEPLFMMNGEMLLGAEQDRMMREDALLPSRRGRFTLPVYCIEQNRTSGSSNTFKPGPGIGPRLLRRALARGDNQAEIWSLVNQQNGRVLARTRTQTLQAAYRSQLYRDHGTDFVQALNSLPKRYPRAIGAMVVINGTVSSLDVFANPDLFAQLWPKLLRSAALDTVSPKFPGSDFSLLKLNDFMNQAASARYHRVTTRGEGQAFRVASPDISGNLLLENDRIIHFTLFPEKTGRARRSKPI